MQNPKTKGDPVKSNIQNCADCSIQEIKRKHATDTTSRFKYAGDETNRKPGIRWEVGQQQI